MHHLGLYFVVCDITVQYLLSVKEDKEVGEKCGNNRFLEDFEVIGLPK
jgi:hypothetical protein